MIRDLHLFFKPVLVTTIKRRSITVDLHTGLISMCWTLTLELLIYMFCFSKSATLTTASIANEIFDILSYTAIFMWENILVIKMLMELWIAKMVMSYEIYPKFIWPQKPLTFYNEISINILWIFWEILLNIITLNFP